MSGLSSILIVVLVAAAIHYMTGSPGRRSAPVFTPEGMRVLQNKRLGVVVLLIFIALGGFFLFFGVLCWQDIGTGQGGVVFLFFGAGAVCVLLGFLLKWCCDRSRVCFDEKRIIQYRAIGRPVEMEWWEVMEYSCDPQKTFLVSADRRRIQLDYTYDGLPELVAMIQEKVAAR